MRLEQLQEADLIQRHDGIQEVPDDIWDNAKKYGPISFQSTMASGIAWCVSRYIGSRWENDNPSSPKGSAKYIVFTLEIKPRTSYRIELADYRRCLRLVSANFYLGYYRKKIEETFVEMCQSMEEILKPLDLSIGEAEQRVPRVYLMHLHDMEVLEDLK